MQKTSENVANSVSDTAFSIDNELRKFKIKNKEWLKQKEVK